MQAVLSADVEGSTQIPEDKWKGFLDLLEGLFGELHRRFSGVITSQIQLSQGDTLQAVIEDPRKAMEVSLALRAHLSRWSKSRTGKRLDVRLALGVGEITDPSPDPGRGRGPAFERSGRALASMKRKGLDAQGKVHLEPYRMVVETGVEEVDRELLVECALMDCVIDRWTEEMAGAVWHRFAPDNPTLREVGVRLKRDRGEEGGLSKAAVHRSLRSAGEWGIRHFLQRYTILIGRVMGDG